MWKTEDKEHVLKAEREKQLITYEGNLVILITNFSSGTVKARKVWMTKFQVLKVK